MAPIPTSAPSTKAAKKPTKAWPRPSHPVAKPMTPANRTSPKPIPLGTARCTTKKAAKAAAPPMAARASDPQRSSTAEATTNSGTISARVG